jgi:hypothetical protein
MYSIREIEGRGRKNNCDMVHERVKSTARRWIVELGTYFDERQLLLVCTNYSLPDLLVLILRKV